MPPTATPSAGPRAMPAAPAGVGPRLAAPKGSLVVRREGVCVLPQRPRGLRPHLDVPRLPRIRADSTAKYIPWRRYMSRPA